MRLIIAMTGDGKRCNLRSDEQPYMLTVIGVMSTFYRLGESDG